MVKFKIISLSLMVLVLLLLLVPINYMGGWESLIRSSISTLIGVAFGYRMGRV